MTVPMANGSQPFAAAAAASAKHDASGSALDLVSVEDIERAHVRIQAFVHRTPLLTSTAVDELATDAINAHVARSDAGTSSCPPVRVRLAFKSEHLQRVGAFKMRGATNAVQTHLERLRRSTGDEDAAKSLWIVTHSSGNHAAAVACAARSVGARAAVVMPRNAPGVKKAAVRGYGARVIECEPTQSARQETADRVMAELRDADPSAVVHFIHPYDEPMVIAGQGTLALEMLQQAKDELPAWQPAHDPVFDIVVAPVGGGGMLSGVSTAITGKDARIRVIAAEPKNADDAARSLSTGILQPPVTPSQTICDGLLTALSERTLAHIRTHVSAILTADERSIVAATRLVWQRMKQLIEPSAAVGLAVVMHNPEFAQHVRAIASKKQRRRQDGDEAIEVRVGVVWTGGNVELAAMAAAFEKYSEEAAS